MLRYGKTAQQAVAAMSYLAERWNEEAERVPSAPCRGVAWRGVDRFGLGGGLLARRFCP